MKLLPNYCPACQVGFGQPVNNETGSEVRAVRTNRQVQSSFKSFSMSASRFASPSEEDINLLLGDIYKDRFLPCFGIPGELGRL